ncbi:MAG: hypothetical protein K0S61_4016 [Anaerocolumna sp.]|jgi:hypothetical protein|nr:hypothetical protein [Anaerocolumna sp.]
MLRITTTNALLGINSTPTKISIVQPKADFQMSIDHPKMEIHSEQVKVQIDQQQCFNESGLKDFATLTRDNAAEAKQACFEGIARRVGEGNRMANIKNRSDAIAEIAFSNSFTQHVFDIVSMPKSRPKIDFIGGTVDITAHEGSVGIQSKINMPIIDVQVGDVEIFSKQYPEIKFEYTENKVDVKL